MSSSNSTSNALALPNINNTMTGLGFKPVNPFGLLNSITNSFGVVIQEIFAWVYFLSEIAILIGVVVWLIGAIGHQSRVKRVGAQIIVYSILGFLAAVILPGIIVRDQQELPFVIREVATNEENYA